MLPHNSTLPTETHVHIFLSTLIGTHAGIHTCGNQTCLTAACMLAHFSPRFPWNPWNQWILRAPCYISHKLHIFFFFCLCWFEQHCQHRSHQRCYVSEMLSLPSWFPGICSRELLCMTWSDILSCFQSAYTVASAKVWQGTFD